MIKIAHRGNFEGTNPELENRPDYIQAAINAGFFVEVDVWKIDNNWFLGHDSPQYKINFPFLNDHRLYLHCKNLAALTDLTSKLTKCDFFAHNNDDWVLTDKGQIWTYPWKETGPNSIIVDFSVNAISNHSNIYGLCADYLI